MHFTAVCQRYPFFKFNVHALRPLLDQRGLKHDSTLVQFSSRVLDTKLAGFTAEEADHIRAALERMVAWPPLYGTDIIIKNANPGPEPPPEHLPVPDKTKRSNGHKRKETVS